MNFNGLHKINESSPDSYNSGLDVFAAPITETSIISGDFIEFPPVNSSDYGTLEFKVPGNNSKYTDLSKTHLQIEAKVVNADGSDLAGDSSIVLADGGIHSFFKAISLSVKGQDVEYDSNYSTRAYMENLINYSAETKKSTLTAAGWHEDSLLCKNTPEIIASGVAADVAARKAVVAGSRTFCFIDKLHLAFLQQGRNLPPGVSFSLALRRNSPNISLIKTVDGDTGTYKIKITSAKLYVRMLEIHPAVVRAQQRVIAIPSASYKYPITRRKSQTFLIQQGIQSQTLHIDQNEQIPKRIIFGFIPHSSFNGGLKTCATKFVHANLKSVELLINGLPVEKRLVTDFENGNYTRAFFNFNMACGKALNDKSSGISLASYKEGRTLFGFDITSDLCEGAGVHFIKSGSISLDLVFASATTATLSLFAYTEKDDLIELDAQHRLRMINNAL